MTRRWTKNVFNKLPGVDQVALNLEREGLQFAAEYSQASFESMQRQEHCLGNYFRQA